MEKEGSERTGLTRHKLIMLLCCLIPLGILAVLWAIGTPSNYLVVGILLLCPLMHVVMIIGARKGGGHAH